MVDETSARSAGTKKPRSRRKLTAMLVAGGLVLTSATVVSVTAANASAEETARLCTIALDEGAAATKAAQASTVATDQALADIKNTKLPKDAGNSTAYAKRPAVKAAPARASGADFAGDASRSRDALAGFTIPTECTDRAQAEGIRSATAKSVAATKALDSSVGALLSDFNVFQADEAKRIAAEEAEAKHQADEAERKAAEKKAKAAEKAAASRQAAAATAPGQSQANPRQHVPPRTVPSPRQYDQPKSAPRKIAPAPRKIAPAPRKIAPAPRKIAPQPKRQSAPAKDSSSGGGYRGSSGTKGGGGGGVVSNDGSNKVCWTSNGMGGTKRCGT